MKQQWLFIFALVFALIIAVFSVVNVEPVPVNYVFGVAEFPLIMVILGSALIGGLVAGLLTTLPMLRQHRAIRSLQREIASLRSTAASPADAGRPPTGDAVAGAEASGAPEASDAKPAANDK